jgi:hypothetical protein
VLMSTKNLKLMRLKKSFCSKYLELLIVLDNSSSHNSLNYYILDLLVN